MAFVLRRSAARVLCFDPEGRLLLIRSHDPADRTKLPWWELPGGGIDPGESAEDACRRELREEVGLASADIGPCVWVQHAQFTFAGWNFDQHERIHVATSDGAITLATHLEAFEATRWWDVDELMASDEPTIPPRLREFLPDVAAGRLPEIPVDISPVLPAGG